jgi:preprotein translocase subunit SecB
MTEQSNKPAKYNLHAIQLISLEILELHIEKDPSHEDTDQEISSADFTLRHGHSEYDEQEKKIGVRIIADVGNDEDHKLPYKLKVEILGIFSVDEEKFPKDKITHWAGHNAPLVLYPYLRENVYALATKVGLNGLILPLFEIPTFKLNN